MSEYSNNSSKIREDSNNFSIYVKYIVSMYY